MIMIMYIFYISPDQIFKRADSITSNVFGWLALAECFRQISNIK